MSPLCVSYELCATDISSYLCKLGHHLVYRRVFTTFIDHYYVRGHVVSAEFRFTHILWNCPDIHYFAYFDI